MGEIGETRSILGTRIRQWMAGTAERICAKFTRKTRLVLRSDELERQRQTSKIKVTTDKTPCALTLPQYGRNGTASLQITSRKQQARRFDRWRGYVASLACVVSAACAWPGGLPLRFAMHF